MDLVIDVGNTRTKLALFDGGSMVAYRAESNSDHDVVIATARGWRPGRIALGCVAREEPILVRELEHIAPTLVIRGSTPAPLENAYATPLTLGADRLANAVAAAAFFPGRASLAIDLGTCITYDLVDAAGIYRGGAISPGLRMRAQAMHAYSARLPLVDPDRAVEMFASTTTDALRAGIFHGVLGEVCGFIQAHVHQAPEGAVVLTGGDAQQMARALKSGIFAHPFLTLEGYRLILAHQSRGGTSGYGVPGGDSSPRPAG
jgi:type III pantothenate kinase